MEVKVNAATFPLAARPASLAGFRAALTGLFGASEERLGRLQFSYKDDEGDVVTLRDDDDFDYMLQAVSGRVVVEISGEKELLDQLKPTQKPADKPVEKPIEKPVEDSSVSKTLPSIVSAAKPRLAESMVEARAEPAGEARARAEEPAEISVINPPQDELEFTPFFAVKAAERQRREEEHIQALQQLILKQTDAISVLQSKLDQISDKVHQKPPAVTQKFPPVAEHKKDEVVHASVFCDVCKTRPIRGKRFVCLVCNNFDICEACESRNAHAAHPMIRVNDPSFRTDCVRRLAAAYASRTRPEAKEQPKQPEPMSEPKSEPKPETKPQNKEEKFDRLKYVEGLSGQDYLREFYTSIMQRYSKLSDEEYRQRIDALFKPK